MGRFESSGTGVHFSVDFAFKSRISGPGRANVRPSIRRMTGAFEKRAGNYGITLERAERCLTADSRTTLLGSGTLVGDDLAGPLLLGRRRPPSRPVFCIGVPPSGPAIPVMATATSAPDASSAPLGHCPGGIRSPPERLTIEPKTLSSDIGIIEW
jgi:hypothetical protein